MSTLVIILKCILLRLILMIIKKLSYTVLKQVVDQPYELEMYNNDK